jgi:glycosyltransferase involved in cell wall biosynthesis
VDRLWEQSELALDRRCASLLRIDQFGAYLGVEHGALSSLQSARALGKPAIVAFFSPHYSTRAEWVDPEYERFPELLTPATRKIRELAKARDARRDEEARTADVVHCASIFTAQSLLRAGLVTHDKLTIVPLGCPEIPPALQIPVSKNRPVRFVCSGTVAVHKGTHILLDAWKRLRPGHSAELHLYGAATVPKSLFGPADGSVFFHGHVSSAELSQAYQESAMLVFPTLCDGFGMVVAEAFAHGLPVITTRNAGAADLVREGRNGYVIPARDAETLAERLAWCIDHPEELRAMRPQARQTALDWRWQDFRSSFRSQLNECLGALCAREASV